LLPLKNLLFLLSNGIKKVKKIHHSKICRRMGNRTKWWVEFLPWKADDEGGRNS
jgi:hypothetical protein